MTHDLPADFTYRDPANFQAKLARFQAAGTDKLHLLFDFDLTLTVNRPEIENDVITWQIVWKHLSEEGRARGQALFAQYRPLEISGKLTEAEARRWVSDSLQVLVDERLDVRNVEAQLIEQTTLRSGTPELFAFCKARNIPTVILSAGLKQVIEMWVRAYDIQPTLVHATSLTLDAQDKVSGWDKTSVVHMLNKREKSGTHDGIAQIRHERPYTLLVGDSLHDAAMAEGDDHVLRLFVHDPRIDERAGAAQVKTQALQLFDAVIEGKSLDPMRQLLEEIVSDTPIQAAE